MLQGIKIGGYMTTQRIANQFFLGCSILAIASAFYIPAFAGEAQFVNVFDKSKM
jgi:hypothetical protein